MEQQTLLSNNVDTSKIVFGDVKSQKSGGSIKSVRLSYKYNDKEEPFRMVVQTAKMKSPFGICNDEKYGNGDKYDIRLSFQGEEKSKSIKRFRECIEKIDNTVIQKGLENCNEWFGKKELANEQLLRMCYKSSIKKNKNEKFADMFRISIPFQENKPRNYIEFLDHNGEQIEWEDVKPHSEVICLIELNAVWLSPGTNQFGISVKLVKMQVFKSKQISGFQIRDEVESDDEQDDLEDNDEYSVDNDADEEVVEVSSDGE